MKIVMRLLTASYRTSDVTVELYGKTQDGKSVTALYSGFKPYFDIVEPTESCVIKYKSNPEFLKMEDKTLWVEGENKKIKRITVKSPWKVPELRQLCGPETVAMAADIPFHHRFIYDFDLGSCVMIEGEESPDDRMKYTTDLIIKISKIENAPDFNPDLKILSFDIENAIMKEDGEDYGKIFVIGYTIYKGGEIQKGYIDGEEKVILQNFLDIMKNQDPDVITGYNIDGYDLPVIEFRMKIHKMSFKIGRDFSTPTRIMNQFWRVHGRIISDTWWGVKKILHPKHETLNYVSKELLGEGKDNINRLKIEEEWKNRREEVIQYCIKDSYLTLLIYNRLRVLDRNMFMSTVTKLPLEDVTNGGTSSYVDSLLIRKADRENIAVPMTFRVKKSNPIEGGYVHTLGAGIYDNVIVLDFKSMYPSMIMKYNICFTTLSPKGTIIAPTGIRFLDKSVKEGLVPRLLRQLMEERDKVKKIMRGSSTEEEHNYYDGVQGALKILMNTFYGVLASSFYRFTNLEIGGAITSFARETITNLISRLEKEGYKVIYGDTDSIFIESGLTKYEDIVKLGEDLSKKISTEEGVIIEFEKVIDPFFSHGAKKRYAGKIIFPEDQAGEILVRGYETRRTDSFDLQSESLTKVFDLIMERKVDEAVEYSKEIVKKVLSGDSSIPMEKLVISRSVKPFKSYADEKSLANVRVAKKLMEMGETFIPGMKVSWIVTNSKKTPQEVEPFVDGSRFDHVPDWEYYARRLEETLNRVLEGIKSEISITEEKSGQVKLDSYESGRKNQTLDSFF
ncbi:DNA polymerase II [Oxyplasma meridianum]|uniref:DNA polymerase n=1 Tax=Oxyplasma meridianum TaxID=3073602 RepID=A0AAX4NHX1_9ARCH